MLRVTFLFSINSILITTCCIYKVVVLKLRTAATKHRIRYIGCIGHIGVQIMLLLDITQYKVVKG